MDSYEETKKYWDLVFAKAPQYDPNLPLSHPELEEALVWLKESTATVLDFGCGSGRLLLRMVSLGVGRALGIDISREAIKLAQKITRNKGWEKICQFKEGGLEELKKVSGPWDAGILSNILDNLIPEDALEVLSIFSELIKPEGKLLLKLNAFIEPEILKGWGAAPLKDNFFQEQTGLYFWNLKDQEVERLLSAFFSRENSKRIYFPEHGQTNRLYYLRKQV